MLEKSSQAPKVAGVWSSGFSPIFLALRTHRPLSSSFLGLPYRILDINHGKELVRGLRGELRNSEIRCTISRL